MEEDLNDEDLRLLSENLLPLTTTPYTNNNTFSTRINRSRSLRSQKRISSNNQIFHKKDVCALKTSIASTSRHQVSNLHEEQKASDKITVVNGARNTYDEQSCQRICANVNCQVILPDSSKYQNSLCTDHYHESCAKNSLVLKSEQMLSSPLNASTLSSSSRKRRHHHSLSSIIPSQVLMTSKTCSPTITANHRLSIASIPPSVDINNPKKGDIIEMENGSRKKFDGVVWRKICSLPNCFIAAQRDELCRKHYLKLNGKSTCVSTNDIVESINMIRPQSKSISSRSTDEKSDTRTLKKLKDESIDYDDPQEDCTDDNISNSYHISDDDTQTNQENSSTMHEDNFNTQIDRTLIDALSACRQKFLTNYLKKWLREHGNHPYPTNQEKIELARQSSITYDQVTAWFNNARAILRRRRSKLENSFDDESSNKNNDDLDSNHNINSRIQQSLSLLNGLWNRSIGIQCNISTINQTTSTSTDESIITDEDLLSDRTIRIIRPSSHVLKINSTTRHSTSEEFPETNINNEEFRKEKEIIITSSSLDEHQMTRVKEFCSRFNIKCSNAIDKSTTHLITDEKDESLVCSLTKKVIQAVARHLYILTIRWIDSCLSMNKIVNEKPYEIQGDSTFSSNHNGMQRSRQSILANNLPNSSIFDKFYMMLKCDGCHNLMNNSELIELVKLSGAKYNPESYFSRMKTGSIRIVLCEKEYLANRKEIYEKYINIGIHFLRPEWFIESLVQYCIQPFEDYQISP